MTTDAPVIEPFRLTSLASRAGCAAKFSPDVLSRMLAGLPKQVDPRLLVGLSTSDDAGVYRLTDEIALVQTVDFFPPIVDDAYWYGAIAVANAISDVYAMGGTPLLGLNLVAYPESGVPENSLAEVLRGGAEKAAEAGVLILGGHSIVDDEPKFGMAVTGIVHPDRVVTNAGAQPGDVLLLTKPLGVGIITTAGKREMADPAHTEQAIQLMATLNKGAAAAMIAIGVHAATDITGFGLLGHLLEMTSGSGVAAEIDATAVPVLEGAWAYAEAGAIPGGTQRNWHYVEQVRQAVRWLGDVSATQKAILADAQTSGGLLIAVAEDRADALVAALEAQRTPVAAVIGHLTTADARGTITVRV